MCMAGMVEGGEGDGARETREWWWLLLTVDTELNGDSKSTNERAPFSLGSLGLSSWYERFLFCLGFSSRPIQNIFSTPYTISIPLSPCIAQQAGQPAVPGRLSLCVRLWLKPTPSRGPDRSSVQSSLYTVIKVSDIPVPSRTKFSRVP